MDEIEDNVLLHSKQGDTKQGHNHQLDWAHFPQNCTVCNQAPGHTEVCIDQTEGGNRMEKTKRMEKGEE